MAKSRSFSIFLLKHGYYADNSLKEDHVLGDSITDASALPEGATLFIMDKAPTPAWWKEYWGIQQNLQQTLKGAIVFLFIDERCFAITFGHTYHNLKESCYEYDFGLRTTLNALDPEKIKSTDILQPENAKRERIQSPIASDLTFFDFNKDESIVKRLTGAVKEEYKNILTNITGASSLKISSKVVAQEIPTLCRQLLEIYNKEDFKQSFPDIQNIIPVKDPSLLNVLNGKLMDAFENESIELVLTIPEIIDHSDYFHIKYTGAGRDDSSYDEVYIIHYRQYLQNKKIEEVTLDLLKSHKLNVKDENGANKHTFSIYKCILFDCEHNSQHYHLCEGEWYRIEKDYIQKLKTALDPIFIEHDLLSECNKKREDNFNSYVASNNVGVICLDKKNISPSGQSQVEPCDLYRVNEDIAELIHIKISTRSSSLSHLFNQGLNSLELLRLNSESKDKLKDLLSDTFLHSPIDENKYAIVYGIVTAKDKSKKSDNLPIFSRISLLRTMNSLQLMGVHGSVVLIKDNVDRKGGK